MFLTTPSSASRTLQSRFSNLEFSLFQTCGKDCNIPPGFILLTVWKITTLDESNEFPLTLHLPVGIGNSQPASFVFLSMVFAGFRTIPAMGIVKIKQIKLKKGNTFNVKSLSGNFHGSKYGKYFSKSSHWTMNPTCSW